MQLRRSCCSTLPWLISVSLDAEAHSCDINLAADDRPCFRHVHTSRCHRNGCPAFDGELSWSAKQAARVYHCDLWLRVFVSGIPSLHGTRVGAPGSSYSDLLRPLHSRDCPLLYHTTAFADGFHVSRSRSALRDWRMRARHHSHTTGFHFGCASPC